MPPSPAVVLDNISIRRNGRLLLDGISLTVASGDLIVLQGANGSGKTTLLELVTGFARPAAGRVVIGGRRITPWNQTTLRRRIGYLPQTLLFDPRQPLRARDLVIMGALSPWGTLCPHRPDLNRQIETIAAEVGIAHLLNRPLGNLSGGELQRAGLARILLQDPDLLIMDEPFNHLDPPARKHVAGLIADRHRRLGMTIILASHLDAPDLVPLARRFRLAHGHLEAAKTPELISSRREGSP